MALMKTRLSFPAHLLPGRLDEQQMGNPVPMIIRNFLAIEHRRLAKGENWTKSVSTPPNSFHHALDRGMLLGLFISSLHATGRLLKSVF